VLAAKIMDAISVTVRFMKLLSPVRLAV
jgi:hypothetical protein